MSVEQAVLLLRQDPAQAERMRESFLFDPPEISARAFGASAEFAEVRRLIGLDLGRASVLDVGAGTGIASWAFANAGAGRVVALEPDPSDVIGQGAIRQACAGLNVEIESGAGEALGFSDGTFDLVYARQVLHHATDLDALLRECARVLVKGGVFLACREHVADDDAQLREFLDQHPVHALAGGEHAFPLKRYLAAMANAGLEHIVALGPWDSIINAYPTVKSEHERKTYARKALQERFGMLGRLAGLIPPVEKLAWKRIDAPHGGRLFTFFARKS